MWGTLKEEEDRMGLLYEALLELFILEHPRIWEELGLTPLPNDTLSAGDSRKSAAASETPAETP